MKNTLLVKEIREMLEDGLFEDIKDFAESNPPDVVANFFEALDTSEIIKIFSFIDEEIAADIFSEFEDEVKNQLTSQMSSRELAELLYELPETMHTQILSILSEEQKAEIHELVEEIDKESRLAQEALFGNIPGIIRDREGNIHESIRVYRPFAKKLKQINKLEKGTLITVTDPGQEEIDFLCKELKIPADFFDYALDMDERARIEEDENCKLVIVKVPYYDPTDEDEMYGTVPLGIIFAENTILLVSNIATELVSKMIENMQKKYLGSLATDDFTLSILYDTTQLFLLYLKQISNIITIVQKKIQETSRNEDLAKLLNLEKSLVYFTTALKSNEFMAMKLRKIGIVPETEENDDKIDDIVIETKQAIEMSSIYNNIVSEMMTAFSSIISNKLNNIMKLLTIITIVLTVPVMFASIYGMNIQLPGGEIKSYYPFAVFIIISIIFSGLVVWYFKKKDWF
ncbi:hypothetical protein J5690_05605 [bacterium]|nr:hypothetical protein [bacterium]